MILNLKRLGHRQKGFTLIELLVVIGILGTLSGVAVPNVAGFIGKGKVEAAMAEQHNLQLAATAYTFDHSGTPPPTMDDLSAYLVNSPEFTWNLSGGSVRPGSGNPLS